MWFRLLALGIVIFCGVMTTLLVRMVYFPEFDRLPKVDPEHVLELFLDNREVTEIFIYKGVEVVGDITFTPRRVAGSDEVTVGFVARGKVELPNLPAQILNWRGKLYLGPRPSRKLQRLEVSVRFAEPAVTTTMQVDPGSMGFHYTVMKDGVVVSDSRTDPNAVGVLQVQMLMAAWGVDPDASGEEGGEGAGGWQARQGVIEIAEHRAGAYFVLIEVPGAGHIKLTFSEAGELLEVATPLGYEMLAPAMRTPPDPLPYAK